MSVKGPETGPYHNGMGPFVERYNGADTWCPTMEPMSQIMIFNHLATFGTIYKSTKGPQVGRNHNGDGSFCGTGTVVWTPGVQPWNQCLKSCFLIIWQLLAPFTSQPRVHKWARTTTGWVLLWNGDSGADTWCPTMESMSQIMFFYHLATFGTIYKSAKGPRVGQFHNGMGPVVERGQWCGHLVSGHGINVSNHVFLSFGNFWHHSQVGYRLQS